MGNSVTLNTYRNLNDDEKYGFVKGLLIDISMLELQLKAMCEAYLKPQQIRYKPEWIEKILNGQKTMTIRRTQYPCGIYDVVSEAEPNTVVCRIEVVRVEKWDTDSRLQRVQTAYDKGCELPFSVHSSGFKFIDDFIQYHRENYAPVKFAHTFQLMKGDDHA